MRKGLNGTRESTEGKTSREAVITMQTIPTVSTWQQLLVEKGMLRRPLTAFVVILKQKA